MRFAIDNKIIENPLNCFYEGGTFGILKRSEEKNYFTPFIVLKNWDLVMTFTIYRYKLTFDSIHLIEQEQCDEN